MGYECTHCKVGTKAAIYSVLALLLAATVLILTFIAFELLGLGDGDDAITNFAATGVLKKLAALPWDKLRIPIVVFQIITQYISITGIPLPNIYRTFLSWADVLNLNVGWLLSLGCLVQVDFYQRLLITTLGPFVAALALAGTYFIVIRRNTVQVVTAFSSQRMVVPVRTAKLEKALAKHYLVGLAVTFLIYSTVSTAVFQTFACDNVDAKVQKSYLRADYSIECGTTKHNLFKVYAGIMVIVYPLGIPALYSYLLWRNKYKLSSKNDASVRMLDRHRDVSLRPTRFLWKSYRPRMYYWEVVECVRRLLLTGAVVFIAPGTTAQAAVACILAVSSAFVALYSQPHADVLDSRIYTVGAMIIFLSMFLSLALKADVSRETIDDREAFGVVLVLLNVVLAVAALVQMVLVGRRALAARQNSVLGLGKIDYGEDSDRIDEEIISDAKAAAVIAHDTDDMIELQTVTENNEKPSLKF
eukprot:11128-Heterococcus_DN1.PRE.3